MLLRKRGGVSFSSSSVHLYAQNQQDQAMYVFKILKESVLTLGNSGKSETFSMSTLATGRTAFSLASGVMMRPAFNLAANSTSLL